MTVGIATQIELDDRGIPWIAGTKVKVAEVVLDKIAHDWSAEEIHFQHPHLSLAQIHAALAYYYENQKDLDRQIEADLEESDRLARELSDPDFRRKLVLATPEAPRTGREAALRQYLFRDPLLRRTAQIFEDLLLALLHLKKDRLGQAQAILRRMHLPRFKKHILKTCDTLLRN